MENKIEEYYKEFQKKSDPLILKSYYELEKKNEDGKLSEDEMITFNNQFTAVKKVVQERNLYIKKRTPSSKTNPKENPNNAFKDGGKSILIGVVICIISLGLWEVLNGSKIFLLGTMVGAFKILEGLVILTVGLFYNLTDKS